MEQKEHRLAVIMVVNVSGFSRMMAKDEDEAIKTLGQINDALNSQAETSQGKLIKKMGDTFFFDFRTALDAVKSAVAVQRESDPEVKLRIGIHLGDIYFYEDDAFGEGINFASRLETLCTPGRVCISGDIYNQVANKVNEQIRSLGEVTIESIGRNIETYELFLSDEEPAVPDSEETEESVDFRELKDLIVDQIRHAGKRLRDERDNGWGEDQWKKPHHPPSPHIPRPADEEKYEERSLEPYQEYKHRVIRNAAMQKMGFVGHIIPYIAVNGFLVFLNLRYSPGFFWAAFPMLGWGIGILSHIARIVAKNRAKKDVESLPDLDKREYKLLRKMHTAKESMATHFASTIGVAALLITVNAITSPGFPWAIFPLVGISIGLITHFVQYKTESRIRRREFMERVFGDPNAAFSDRPPMKQVYPHSGSGDPLTRAVAEADSLKADIINQMKTMEKENAPLGDEMLPILDNYVEQIRALAEKTRELDHIIATLPVSDLEKDKTVLLKKLEETGTEVLKQEYEKSIGEIEKQISSFDDLKDQKEVINLRLSSAVNSLKQMQIDLARMKTLTSSKEKTSAEMLQEKSRELSAYLEDLKESYRELDEPQGE